MNVEKFLQKFVPVFVATFIANLIIINIFNFIRWGTIDFYWETPLTLGLTIGIVYALIEDRRDKKEEEETKN